ncbi:MAG: transcription elongation factor Spt5 [Thaumarchaeota archaeon]|nr:transcription elongation factor Spt5 [Candidatus Terraquivivens yellowstonensis]MCL7392743.1 transcription elongation factor Spt5 [Candidatus Terraquivivens yellowstonensis]MCL7395178.1 transcription elongation factor Spt5 [Candidatus Terraquivivens yellowstonensis]MCL7398406.1 transcription elongation factor Spt5 [Candidatus Terraquivivens yellowstonensis]MCL7398703.1 transcription elongation factor Spt5 [Candidatus Terraquivivens yellowstonensis]
MSTEKYKLFAIKTTVGQERNVARILESRIRGENAEVASILTLPDVKGYIFVEAKNKEVINTLIQGIRHIKSRPVIPIDIKEISNHLVEKPIIDMLSEGDTVEVTAGPLKGITGKVIRIDRAKREVTVELSEAAFPLPISVSADQIRIVSSQKGGA